MTATKTNERPGTRAVHRYCGMSASKARQVLDLIRGEDVQRAAEILNGVEREAAEVIGKVLASAVANAAHNDQQNPEELYVSACYADEGCDHEALAPPGAGPGHPDPQADLPHHHHREPAPRRPARAAPPPHGGGQRQPVAPGRRLAAPGRPVRAPVAPPGRPGRGGRRRGSGRRPSRTKRPRRSRTRRWPRRRSNAAEPEVTEADTVDGGVDDDVEDAGGEDETAAAEAGDKSEDE